MGCGIRLRCYRACCWLVLTLVIGLPVELTAVPVQPDHRVLCLCALRELRLIGLFVPAGGFQLPRLERKAMGGGVCFRRRFVCGRLVLALVIGLPIELTAVPVQPDHCVLRAFLIISCQRNSFSRHRESQFFRGAVSIGNGQIAGSTPPGKAHSRFWRVCLYCNIFILGIFRRPKPVYDSDSISRLPNCYPANCLNKIVFLRLTVNQDFPRLMRGDHAVFHTGD